MKTAIFCSAFLLAAATAFAGETLKPCCSARPAAADEAAPVGFTKDSLYQTDVRFTDDAGRPFALGELRGRPVLVSMFFASCSYACPLIVADLTRVRSALPESVRDEAVILLVSFDSERDTTEVLRAYRSERLLDKQWVLLRGEPDAVRELATLLGVSYKLESDGQYAHTNLITVLNREGEVVHHRTGLRGGLEQVVGAVSALARK
jgi:protein SCO1/2